MRNYYRNDDHQLHFWFFLTSKMVNALDFDRQMLEMSGCLHPIAVKRRLKMYDCTLWMSATHLAQKIETSRQLEEMNDAEGIPVDLSIVSGRPVHLEFNGLQSRALSVWTTESRPGFRSTRRTSSDLYTVRFVTCGAMLRTDRGGDTMLITDRDAVFTSFDEMLHEEAGPKFSAISATVSREHFAKACLDMECDRTASGFRLTRHAGSSAMRGLRNSLNYVVSNIPSNLTQFDLITPLIQNLLVYQMISACYPVDDRHSSSEVGTCDRPVKLAMDYIDAHIDEAIDLNDIARAAGVGVRRLQVIFKNIFGYGPVQYTISRRLDLVYNDIRERRAGKVSDIAMRWGFVHMSDFSQRFKERFGVTPKSVISSR